MNTAANHDALRQTVVERYSSPVDVECYRRRVAEGLREWERRVVGRDMRPSSVLCIGCGGGRESFALEALGYEVTGMDMVAAQVESARAAARERHSTARFLVYDGKRLPFADQSFGAVTMWSQVLGNVPGASSRLALLCETRRVLSAGGVLSLSVHERAKTLALLESSGDRYRYPEEGEPGDLLIEAPSGGECYWHYFHADELEGICRDAGYREVKINTSGDLGQEWDNLLVAVCSGTAEAQP